MEPLPGPDTRTLARRACGEGDHARESLNLLVGRLVPDMLKAAYGILRDRKEDAEDAVQNASLAFIKNVPRLAELNSPRAWFSRILKVKCWQSIRKQKRRKEQPGDEMFAETPGAEPGTWDQEREERIREAVRSLPEDLRVVAELYGHSGMTIEEIAEVIERSRSATHERLERCRDALRSKLGEEAFA